jgi:hypothetical protein
MPIKTSGQLTTDIGIALADNNAGEISAADVRNSILDTVASINHIVANGDFTNVNPFLKNITIKRTIGDNGTGQIIVESGIRFANDSNSLQTVAYPGPGHIEHNDLDKLDEGDPHTQYIPKNGSRVFELGNIGFSNCWINSSGSSNAETTLGKGLQFRYLSSSKENINVGSGTQFTFLKDNSVMNSSRGVAKAWIRFEASGVGGDGRPVVKDAYNVSGIKKQDIGKFTIIFNSGVFKDNNYVAVGHSNGRSLAGSMEDFSENTVAMSYRTGDDATKLRSISFVVMGEDVGAYLDGKINDLVVFGTEPAGSGYADFVVINPTYNA